MALTDESMQASVLLLAIIVALKLTDRQRPSTVDRDRTRLIETNEYKTYLQSNTMNEW